ncbi:NmrA family NAD(P)-binding protein [Amycolatopsis sp. Hca4]|uniref:NmrA family NAD(P)-binding protein n=1 Tax=Amycolatopsis sp. Hca4 TaxID=2742131 RepID=UPI001590A5BC|nr:NmrA family NAD(P)-binding protein [Amycolatopsis sp. Hca4]QKV81763.1 NmrA family NAD(P)-binding protein [Amycolatopsis sp. Hca4]
MLVTGATGKTGTNTTRTLLDQGHHVRALVHRADDRANRLARAGAEVVVADLLDLDAVSRAANGIDAAYLTYPIAPGLLEATATLLRAAEENGVGAIVDMSQISARRDAASNAARQHWLAERLLDHFTGAVIHIRPTFFAEWLINFWDPTTGELRLPFADARHAPIAAEDQGRVIAAVLAAPEPHTGKTYRLHGPVELDHHQITDAMSRTLGRKITYVPIELDEFRSALEQRGLEPHFVQHLISVAVDYRNGIFAGTNDNVRALTGVEPLTVEAFIERNKQYFDGRESSGNR